MMNPHTKDFAGLNGFVWWVGVVEDRQDPLKLGRCRVRIAGWHADNKVLLPSTALPWAQILTPVNNTNTYTPKESDMVVGFFLDGENAQQPIIMGVLPGIPLSAANNQQPFNDPRTQDELNAAPVKPNESSIGYPRKLDEPTTSRLARNESIEDSIVSHKANNKVDLVEPDSYYNAKYPYNNVYESESGHAIEVDDTPSAERVHIYHRSGSYVEWGPDGDRAERVQKDKFTVVIGDEQVYIKGDVTVTVEGDYNLNVTGDIKINGKTVNINQGTMGAARIGDTADTGDDPPGISGSDGTNKIETGSGTVFIGD